MTVEARELAVQVLYEADVRQRLADTDVSGLPPRARRLVEGVLESIADLDAAIDQASEHWRIDRMPVVDRSILRLGLYELIHQPTTPSAVVLSEAVRIAKEFSTEKSGVFVNGVLAALAERFRPAG